MYINAVSSVIPGSGNNFGKLQSTDEILKQIQQDGSDDFDTTFVSKQVGIKSIALTNSSINAMADTTKKASQQTNTEIYDMLDEAIGQALQQSKEKCPGSVPKFHIHIYVVVEPTIKQETERILTKHGVSTKVQTIFLQEGCAGILEAIELAKYMLKEEGESLLLTCENNTILHSNMRNTNYAHKKNMDDWMYGAIFGEGVGAMVLANKPAEKGVSLEIVESKRQQAADEWRVKDYLKDGERFVKVKAKEVKKTYVQNVCSLTKQAVAKYGPTFGHYLFHESNPKILLYVLDALNIPVEKTKINSNTTGTLACVSSFLLLDQCLEELDTKETLGDNDKIHLAVIGETGGSILAGSLVLAPQRS